MHRVAGRPGQLPRSGCVASSSSGACSHPTREGRACGIEARVTFEDGTTEVWELPQGPRSAPTFATTDGASGSSGAADDYKGLWAPTARWIAERVRRPAVAGREGGAGADVPREHPRGRPAALQRVHVLHLHPRLARPAADVSHGRPASPWDRFFFEPQSTAPMTLVRVGWGAATAVVGAEPAPRHRPVLHGGRLLYERNLATGAWNLLPHLGWEQARAGGVPACSSSRRSRRWSASRPG